GRYCQLLRRKGQLAQQAHDICLALRAGCALPDGDCCQGADLTADEAVDKLCGKLMVSSWPGASVLLMFRVGHNLYIMLFAGTKTSTDKTWGKKATASIKVEADDD